MVTRVWFAGGGGGWCNGNFDLAVAGQGAGDADCGGAAGELGGLSRIGDRGSGVCIGSQTLTVSTNASNGYTVYTRYTAKPTSGSNTIADQTGTNAAPTAFPAPGTAAFGYTTNASALGTGTANRFTITPNVWAAFTTSNNEVAFSSAPVSSQATCVGYQVGIAGTTPAGTYTNTVIFTATPVF